jgi:hypothetical protein
MTFSSKLLMSSISIRYRPTNIVNSAKEVGRIEGRKPAYSQRKRKRPKDHPQSRRISKINESSFLSGRALNFVKRTKSQTADYR